MQLSNFTNLHVLIIEYFLQFNLTGVIWKDEFNCESKPLTLKTVLPAIFLTCFIIILTYTCEPFILSWLFPSKIEQRVLIGKFCSCFHEIFHARDR